MLKRVLSLNSLNMSSAPEVSNWDDVSTSVCLFKQGEFIRNWRSRHFLLMKDGNFFGYNKNPFPHQICHCSKAPRVVAKRLNHFKIDHCTVREEDSISSSMKSSNLNLSSSLRGSNYRLNGVQMGEGRYMFTLEDLYRCDDESTVTRHFYVTTEEVKKDLIDDIRKIQEKKKRESIQSLRPKRKRISEDQYTKLGLVGTGAYGRVYIAEDNTTNKLVALKILEKSLLRRKDFTMTHVRNESFVARKVDHPFIAKQYGAGQSAEVFIFVMEFLPGGDLFSYLYHKSKVNNPFYNPYTIERCTMLVSAMLVSALKYLHTKNIVYRDLKLENLMLDEKGYVKIIDFGISKEIYEGERAGTFCGTPQYIAPEIILSEYTEGTEDQGYGMEIDWWTLGILVYELIYKTTPFQPKSGNARKDHRILFNRILQRPPNFLKEVKVATSTASVPTLSESLINFLRGLLDKNPESRLGDSTIMEHEFLKEVDFEKLERREIKSLITVKPFSRDHLYDYIVKQKTKQKSDLPEVDQVDLGECEPIDDFSYAHPDA